MGSSKATEDVNQTQGLKTPRKIFLKKTPEGRGLQKMQGMIGLSSTSGRRGRQMYLRTGGRNMQRGELIVGSEEYRKEEKGGCVSVCVCVCLIILI